MGIKFHIIQQFFIFKNPFCAVIYIWHAETSNLMVYNSKYKMRQLHAIKASSLEPWQLEGNDRKDDQLMAKGISTSFIVL